MIAFMLIGIPLIVGSILWLLIELEEKWQS